MPIAVVVQCFVKLDTLKAVLTALLRCDRIEDVDLIIWQDGLSGSHREQELKRPWLAVHQYRLDFAKAHQSRFRSVRVYGNAMIRGPYKTCQYALDLAFEKHDFAIFLEDDVILSRDAIVWFLSARHLLDGKNWAIAAESIFFDAQQKQVEQSFVERAILAASERGLVDKYVAIPWIPSSSFATSRELWAEFGETRGEIVGDVRLGERCQKEEKNCIYPVIARGKDVGMLHDLGLTVSVHSKESVGEIKNTYVLAEDVLPPGPISLEIAPFTGNPDTLYWESSQLFGFRASQHEMLEAAS